MFEPGDRIILLAMTDDPDPIPVGTTGYVVSATYHDFFLSTQVIVRWDPPHDRRSLALVIPPDRARKV
jgi:hypothetical protein